MLERIIEKSVAKVKNWAFSIAPPYFISQKLFFSILAIHFFKAPQ